METAMSDDGIRGDRPARVNRRCASSERTPAVHSGPRYPGVPGALAHKLAIGLVLSVWMAACSTMGDDENARDTDIGSLTAHLESFAYEQLSFRLERSRPLSPPARRAINEFVASGAHRLHADGATAQRIATAENNLARFTSALSEAADRSEHSSISPATVEATRNRLCPLYPFC